MGNITIDLKGVKLDSSTPITLVSGTATGLDKANILTTEFITASITGKDLVASLDQNSVTNFKNSLDSSQSTLFNSIVKHNEFIYTQGDSNQIKAKLDSTKDGLESSVLTPFSVFEMLEANFISARLASSLDSTYLGLNGFSSKMSGANLNGGLNGFGIHGKLKFNNFDIFSKLDYGYLNNNGSNVNNSGHTFAINSLLTYKLNFLEFGFGGNVSSVLLDSKRSFNLGNLNLNSNGAHNSFIAGINAEIGTRIYLDSMSIKPFIGAKFNFINVGDLKESGDLGGVISGKNGVTLSGVVGVDGGYKVNQMFSLNARGVYEIEAFNSFGKFLGGVYGESNTNLAYNNLNKFGVYLGGSLKFQTFNLSLNGYYKHALESVSFYGGEVSLGYRF